MNLVALAFLLGVAVISLALTGLFRNYARGRNLLDHPNLRSSHTRPTPRGGGVVIVVVCLCAALLLWVMGTLDARFALAWIVGGGLVAATGYLDDRGSVGVGLRIAAHFVAAILAVALIGGIDTLQLGSTRIELGAFGWVVAVLGVVWYLNLFNFMDGIDGIASVEAVFVAIAGALLLGYDGLAAGTLWIALILASATLGFLFWNRPPASIFMGDVGSGFLGYALAILALASMARQPQTSFVWLTLMSVFLVDATLTLLRRLMRGERVYQAHRSHAYQWLARRWNSHGAVTLAALAVNVVWLLPLAAQARKPQIGAYVFLVAIVPLAAIAWYAGAGRPESTRGAARTDKGGQIE